MAESTAENFPTMEIVPFSDDSECSDIERSAAEAIQKTMPKKSKENYEKTYKKFCNWCEQKKVKIVTENVMLGFFNEKSKVVKSSTMWSEYSKLKCMIYKERRVDISKFHGLIAFLKRMNVGHIAKKSDVLTKEDFNKFILEADDDQFLMMKVIFERHYIMYLRTYFCLYQRLHSSSGSLERLVACCKLYGNTCRCVSLTRPLIVFS